MKLNKLPAPPTFPRSACLPPPGHLHSRAQGHEACDRRARGGCGADGDAQPTLPRGEGRLAPAFLTLGRCIGALSESKLLCNNDLASFGGSPRCRRSVAQTYLVLQPLRAVGWRRVRRRDDHLRCRRAFARGDRPRRRPGWAPCRLLRGCAPAGPNRARRGDAHRPAVFGIALGYEDLNDHEHLRHDPAMAVQQGKANACRPTHAPSPFASSDPLGRGGEAHRRSRSAVR